MNYIKISKCDIANGPGVRVVLWTAGCSHHCYQCHNPETWDTAGGQLFDKKAEEELFSFLSPSYISGITFSGGDPMHENNIEKVLELTEKIRKRMHEKSIWLYTGYTWEEIMESKINETNMEIRRKIINNIDILVDGPFILKLKDISLKWKGSSNQRVINVKESIKEGKIVLAY